MLFGKVCSGTEVDDGGICGPYQKCHPKRCSTPKISHRETAPMEEPTRTLFSVELSSKEIAPTGKCIRELAVLMAADTELAGGPTPPVQCEREDEGEDQQGQFPGWIKMFHSAQLVTPMEQNSPTPSKLGHWPCSHSAGGPSTRGLKNVGRPLRRSLS